jgi:hypothetical protein
MAYGQDADLSDTDSGALAGRLRLIYGSVSPRSKRVAVASDQRRELTATPGQCATSAHLRTGRLTRCANRPSKPLISLAGCPFRAENRGWPLSSDAGNCLIAEVVSKPGAGSRFAGRSVCFEHED